MRKYKYIIWDIDGTLLDTIGINVRTLQRVVYEELEKELSFNELVKYMAFPGKVTLEKLGIGDINNVHKRWVKYVNEDKFGAIPYEGITEVLDSIKELGYVQAVASSKTKDQYQIDMVKNGFHKYMKATVLFEDVVNSKPHPEPILRAIEILGAKPCECLYIGDTYSDYLCAKEAGTDFALALWGCVNKDGIECIKELETPIDLVNILVV